MKKIGICCLGLLFSLCSYAQVQREYHLISAEKIENKAYYFTALLREFGEVDSMICHDPVLKKMGLKNFAGTGGSDEILCRRDYRSCKSIGKSL